MAWLDQPIRATLGSRRPAVPDTREQPDDSSRSATFAPCTPKPRRHPQPQPLSALPRRGRRSALEREPQGGTM